MSQPLSASNSSVNDGKADQIAHKFYNKFVLLVSDARATAPVLLPKVRVDKWFNIETPETEQFRDVLKAYRALSTSSPPPLVLSVVLIVPEMTNGEVVVFHTDGGLRVPLSPTPLGILLEQWTLSWSSAATNGDFVLSTVYKHAIATFRSQFTLLRVLPAWRIHKRASRRARGRSNTNMSIELQLGDSLPSGVLEFGTQLAPTLSPIRVSQHTFPPVLHPSGSLSISVRYLDRVEFYIEALESLLSSTFLRQDQPTHDPTKALEFTPTLLRHRTESLQHPRSIGSGSSPGMSFMQPQVQAIIPSSAPRPMSSALIRTDIDRIILPKEQGRSSTPNSDIVFPSGSGVSPKLAVMRLEDREPPIRTRRDSSSPGVGSSSSGVAGLQLDRTGTSADAPQTSPGFPARRTSINAIHPFKSGTLSGSIHSPSPAQSLRTQSPLTTIAASTMSARGTPGVSRPISFPVASGIGVGLVESPTSPNLVSGYSTRPSPPYAPSSLVERRSIGAGSASGGSDPSTSLAGPTTGTSAKRFSSTFGNRYSTPPSADADLSGFVQAIDERQPLRHAREASGPDPAAEERALRAGAMRTSQREVRDTLKEMHEKFAKSLEGLEGRRRRDSSGSPSDDSTRFRVPDSPVVSRPPTTRRDSGGISSPLSAGFSPRPQPHRRESTDAAPTFARPQEPAPYRRDGMEQFRRPASPANAAQPNPYVRPASNSPRLGGPGDESPFRDSDDNASDRGSVQLHWRPRVGSRAGTDSDGLGGGAGGSGSDIVGRMEL